MEPKELLPKRVVRYIHDMGVRSLDHLAENFEPLDAAGEGAAPNAVHGLVRDWQQMSTDEKEHFVERVAVSVVEVLAASAALPLGLRLGKKAAKAVKKVINKQAKRIRKAAKARRKVTAARKKTKRA